MNRSSIRLASDGTVNVADTGQEPTLIALHDRGDGAVQRVTEQCRRGP